MDDAAENATKLRDSALGEGVVLVFAYFGGLGFIWYFESTASTWCAFKTESGGGFTLAGWWYGLVSIPILQFFRLLFPPILTGPGGLGFL